VTNTIKIALILALLLPFGQAMAEVEPVPEVMNRPEVANIDPLIKIDPVYPTDAMEQIKKGESGILGWVVVEFDLTRRGNTENIRVLDASPEKKGYENAALAAVKQWRYPIISDGTGRGMSIKGVKHVVIFEAAPPSDDW
jgi:TonB family protein